MTDMYIGGNRIAVSLLTLEFKPDGGGTLLKLTEQDVFLDSFDNVRAREGGTHQLRDALEKELRRPG